jgi:hypothetical protein
VPWPAARPGRCGDDPYQKEWVTVTIPILPVFDDILRAGPCGELAFICGERGQPLTKESFGIYSAMFATPQVSKKRTWYPQDRRHPRRAHAATVAELDAIFGLAGRRHGRALCP